MEVEAAETGVLERILVAEGAEKVAVNTPIALIAPAEFAAAAAPETAGRRRTGESKAYAPLRVTVREALREALAEEMRRDANGLRPRRGGRRLSGRVPGHAGSVAGIRRAPGGGFADLGTCLRRAGRRRGHGGPAPGDRVHELQFRAPGDGPHRQFRRQDALYVGRRAEHPDRLSRPQRRALARRRPARPGFFRLVRPCSGPESRRAL